MSDEAFLLGELEAGGAGVMEAFDQVSGRLTGSQARALHALAVTRSRNWSLPAAAAVLGLPEAQAERILEALVDAAVLTSPGSRRTGRGPAPAPNRLPSLPRAVPL